MQVFLKTISNGGGLEIFNVALKTTGWLVLLPESIQTFSQNFG